MARPKKVEEKPKDSGSLQISVEDFVRTRNSVSFIHFLRICGSVATRLVHFTTSSRLSNHNHRATTRPPHHNVYNSPTSALYDSSSTR